MGSTGCHNGEAERGGVGLGLLCSHLMGTRSTCTLCARFSPRRPGVTGVFVCSDKLSCPRLRMRASSARSLVGMRGSGSSGRVCRGGWRTSRPTTRSRDPSECARPNTTSSMLDELAVDGANVRKRIESPGRQKSCCKYAIVTSSAAFKSSRIEPDATSSASSVLSAFSHAADGGAPFPEQSTALPQLRAPEGSTHHHGVMFLANAPMAA